MIHPSPAYDFPISILEEEYNTIVDYSPYHKGIYSVYLNQLIKITFIPSFRKEVKNWPPKYIDEMSIESHLDACIDSVFNHFSVTPYNLMEGKQERLELGKFPEDTLPLFAGKDKKPATIFYTSEEIFNVYLREIEELNQEISGLFQSKKCSELQDYALIDFILNRFLKSEYIDENDLKILGRSKGTIG